jgi:HEAT repeat protein
MVTGTSAFSFLVQELKQSHTYRGPAAALGMMGGAKAVPHLVEALGSYTSRQEAAETLAKLGQAAIPALLAAAAPPIQAPFAEWQIKSDNDGWQYAAVALGKIGDARAVPALIAVVKSGLGDSWKNYREDGTGRYHIEYRNRWAVEEAHKLLAAKRAPA